MESKTDEISKHAAQRSMGLDGLFMRGEREDWTGEHRRRASTVGQKNVNDRRAFV
jgi:hypothetical protein